MKKILAAFLAVASIGLALQGCGCSVAPLDYDSAASNDAATDSPPADAAPDSNVR